MGSMIGYWFLMIFADLVWWRPRTTGFHSKKLGYAKIARRSLWMFKDGPKKRSGIIGFDPSHCRFLVGLEPLVLGQIHVDTTGAVVKRCVKLWQESWQWSKHGKQGIWQSILLQVDMVWWPFLNMAQFSNSGLWHMEKFFFLRSHVYLWNDRILLQ